MLSIHLFKIRLARQLPKPLVFSRLAACSTVSRGSYYSLTTMVRSSVKDHFWLLIPTRGKRIQWKDTLSANNVKTTSKTLNVTYFVSTTHLLLEIIQFIYLCELNIVVAIRLHYLGKDSAYKRHFQFLYMPPHQSRFVTLLSHQLRIYLL